MLKKLDIETKRLLELADEIERTPRHFDMGNWCDCIAGHAVRLFSDNSISFLNTREAAKTVLGLTENEATDLFQPRDPNSDHPAVWCVTRFQASAAVRRFALTGEVLFA